MNERIKELAEQAGMALKPRRLYDDNEPDGYLESDLDYLDNNLEATRVFFEGGLEKFAELIVRECAVPMITQARTMDAHSGYKNNPIEVTAMNLHQGLLKHFGVEE